MAAESAHAASVLQDLANQTISFVDPAPGEYLLSHTHADWATSSLNSDGSVSSAMNEQTIDVYMPSDPDADWILYRDWGDISGITGQGNKETIRAEGGTFYDDSPWLVMDFDDIPLGTGEETLAYFDEQYFGGNASRDEDNFVRIVDVLASGLVPAKQRASLFEALALIPGVTSTNDVANFDGDKGIAIGRTEVLRGGVRDEIILDPKTGLVIGERQMTTIALFGFGINTVLNATAVETSVVDTAP